ncbi:hypothetical protein HDV06_006809 [Boothiomyces sp. JEL0866]|nr:hypothetical protein HDV06_006809 [Boothiomyces sp. JEL0866]
MRITAWTVYKELNASKVSKENPALNKCDINRILSQNFKQLTNADKRQLLIDYQSVKSEPPAANQPPIVQPPVPNFPFIPPHVMCCQSYFPPIHPYMCHGSYPYPLEQYGAPINVNHQMHNPTIPKLDLQSTDMLIKVDTNNFKTRSQSFNEQILNRKIDGYEVISPKLLGIEYVDTKLQEANVQEPLPLHFANHV